MFERVNLPWCWFFSHDAAKDFFFLLLLTLLLWPLPLMSCCLPNVLHIPQTPDTHGHLKSYRPAALLCSQKQNSDFTLKRSWQNNTSRHQSGLRKVYFAPPLPFLSNHPPSTPTSMIQIDFALWGRIAWRKQSGSIHHPVRPEPRAINNTLLARAPAGGRHTSKP